MARRPDALRTLAARLGYAVRCARRDLGEHDRIRFIGPICEVLEDVGDALRPPPTASLLQNVHAAPSNVTTKLELLTAVATRPSLSMPSSTAPRPVTISLVDLLVTKCVPNNGVTSKSDCDRVHAALGQVFASVPEPIDLDVYAATSAITDCFASPLTESLVYGADAENAFEGVTCEGLALKDVVIQNQVASAGAPSTTPTDDKIAAASQALSEQSDPILKEVNWPTPDETAEVVPQPPEQALAGRIKRVRFADDFCHSCQCDSPTEHLQSCSVPWACCLRTCL